MSDNLGRLPREPVDSLAKPFLWFLRIEAASGAVLLFCTLLALALSNSPWAEQFLSFWETPVGIRFGAFESFRSLQHWINDGLMTLFFFLVALELKREIVLGELRNPRMAALSLAGAAGGMIVPVAVFLWWNDTSRGWGSVMATDTAFVIGCLAVLGARVPSSLRLFLLSLAIFDDIGAILVVAIGYGGTIGWMALAAAGVGLAFVALLARLGVRSVPVYVASGIGVWLSMDASGIHATLAGVALGLLTPARSWISDLRLRAILDRVVTHADDDIERRSSKDDKDLKRAGIAAREAFSPVERLESLLHPWVAFLIMPLFALANAGVSLVKGPPDGAITLAIFMAFLFGKPAGVFVFSYFAVRLRLAVRPRELRWSMLAAGSLLTGIGFTMALFIARLAFESDQLDAAKVGILAASVGSAVGGLAALSWLTRRNSGRLVVATRP